jgi:hypothetical protein
MKPLKNITGLAAWMMRLSLLLTLFIMFFPVFLNFKFNTVDFYIATTVIVFGVLLLVGGIISVPLTVVSSVVLFAVSVFKIFMTFGGKLNLELSCWIVIASICAYFITHGNK